MLTSILLSLFILPSHAQPPCRANTSMPDELTPEILQVWLGRNQNLLRDPGDFICCLPAKYRQSNFIIMHSSVAGQNGTPESPRLILQANLGAEDGLRQTAKTPNSMIFTINGGAANLRQKDSVEILNFQAQTGTADYYDLENIPTAGYKLSQANPSQCMLCHGENSKVPKHGAKVLFDTSPHWPRAVGGAQRCNPEEDKLQLLKSKRALEAVRDNPRFACLDRSMVQSALDELNRAKKSSSKKDPFEKHSDQVSRFDSFVSAANNQRVTKIIVNSQDYQAYKYAIAGLNYCSEDLEKNLSQWIPSEVLERHSDRSFILSDNAQITSGKALQARQKQLKEEALVLRRKQKLEATDLARVYREPLEPGKNVYACIQANSSGQTDVRQMQALKIKNPDLRAYTVDQMLGAAANENTMGAMSGMERFLFEARGIGNSNWSRDIGRGYYRESYPTGMLVYEELSNSELTKITNAFYDQIAPEKNSSRRERAEIEKKFCENLRRSSFAALQKISGGHTPAGALKVPGAGAK